MHDLKIAHIALLITSIAVAMHVSLTAGCWSEDDELPYSEDECTEIGCVDMLVVEIRFMDQGSFEEGYYDFTFSSPGTADVVVHCALRDGEVDCSGDTDLIQMEVLDSSSGLVATVFEARESFAVRIELDGRLLGDRVFHPKYQIVTPNGPDCEPTCFQTTVAMDIAATGS